MTGKPHSASSIVWATTTEYLQKSSFSGVSHAAKARNWFRAGYWSIVFIAGLGFTIRNLYVLIDEFLQYPITTTTEVVSSEVIGFPAITVCNQNRISCLNLEDHLFNMRAKVDKDSAPSQNDLSGIEKLDDFSIKIGCRSQVCETMGTGLNWKRDDTSQDILVLTMGKLSCHGNFHDKVLYHPFLCYHLYTMAKLDDSVPEDIKLEAENHWNSSSCDLYSGPRVCLFAETHVRPRVKNEWNLTVGEKILDECNLYGVATHAEVDEQGSDGIGGISIKRKKRAMDDVTSEFADTTNSEFLRGEHLSAEKPLPFILPKSVEERKTPCTLCFAENVSSKRDQELPLEN